MLQPFAAAAILARRWDWLLLPALMLVLLGFLIREPLTALARRIWSGHRTPWERPALWLTLECAGALVCLALCLRSLPAVPLLVLVSAGLVLTAVSVAFAIHNRQRSTGLQLVAVAGLGSSGLLAALVTMRTIPEWAWMLWAVLSVHGMVGVLCVHARLESMIAAKRGSTGSSPRRPALLGVAAQLAGIAPAVLLGVPELAAPIVFSSAAHALELRRLALPGAGSERLRAVGFRMLAISLAHMSLTIAVLWPHAD